jgi:hypothetical protein
MTPQQRELARHALGLPNDNYVSYRNHFVIEAGDTYEMWRGLVANGYACAARGKQCYFYLTRKGAEAALDFGESLSLEDFPIIWYRYREQQQHADFDEWGDVCSGTRLELACDKYRVKSITKRGVWLTTTYPSDFKKLVVHSWVKKYACPTVEEALVSFLARKKRQHGIYTKRAATAARAIGLAEKALADERRANGSA